MKIDGLLVFLQRFQCFLYELHRKNSHQKSFTRVGREGSGDRRAEISVAKKAML